jgi:exoribonuclease R
LHDVIGQLDLHKAPDLAFALALRRAGGGARYAFYRSSDATTTDNDAALGDAISKPWHAAIAASYAHVTAPMRRLADRYVLELLLAQFAHDQAAVVELSALLRSLPAVMEIAERRAARVERDCVELIEAGLLAPLIGSVLPATVIDAGHDGWLVQLDQPAVLWRIRPKPGQHAQYGDAVKVRVVMSTTKPVDLQIE